MFLGDGKSIFHCRIMLLSRQMELEGGYGWLANWSRGAYVRDQQRHASRKNAAFLAQQQVPRIDPDLNLRRFPRVGHDSRA